MPEPKLPPNDTYVFWGCPFGPNQSNPKTVENIWDDYDDINNVWNSLELGLSRTPIKIAYQCDY